MSSDTFPCNLTPQMTFGRQNDGYILWQRISVCLWTFLLELKDVDARDFGLEWSRNATLIALKNNCSRVHTRSNFDPCIHKATRDKLDRYLTPPWKWTIPLVRAPCISSRSVFRASFPCWESVIRGPCPCLCPKNDIASSNSKPNLKATKWKSRWANIYTCSLVPWYKLSHPNFVCWP